MVPKLHLSLFPKTASYKGRLTGYKQFSKLKHILTFVRFLIVMQIFTIIPKYKFSYVNLKLNHFSFLFFPLLFFFLHIFFFHYLNIKICALCKIGKTKTKKFNFVFIIIHVLWLYEFQEGNHFWQFIIAHVLLFYAVRPNVGIVCWRVKVAQT